MVESFDDFKERLIRIEENVKDVKNVKGDVEELKIKHAALESKSTSAHKRIDAMALKSEVDDIAGRVDKVEKNIAKAVWIVLTAVILAVMGFILV